MNTYKITNITDQLGKRDVNFKSEVKIEYVDGKMKKFTALKAGDSMYLTVRTLPLSIHRLRIKGMISISEATAAELKKAATPQKKSKPVAKKEVEMPLKTSPKKTTRKTSSTKTTSTSKKTTSTTNETE